MKKRIKLNSVIILGSLVLLASLFLGFTVAWFTSNDSASGTITMGHLNITKLSDSDDAEISWTSTNIAPGESIASGTYKATIDTNIAYYTRVLFKADVSPVTGATHSDTCTESFTTDNDILSISLGGGGL